MKKLISLLTVLFLFGMFSQEVFADSASDQDVWTSEKLRIPIEIIQDQKDSLRTAAGTKIEGYVDFWVTIAGRFVTPHYEIEVDTPPDAFITGLDLLVYYSGNEFNNGDKYDPIYRVALGTKHLVGKGDPHIYTQGGSFSATISGEVLTNKGVAMVVPSNKSVYFKIV